MWRSFLNGQLVVFQLALRTESGITREVMDLWLKTQPKWRILNTLTSPLWRQLMQNSINRTTWRKLGAQYSSTGMNSQLSGPAWVCMTANKSVDSETVSDDFLRHEIRSSDFLRPEIRSGVSDFLLVESTDSEVVRGEPSFDLWDDPWKETWNEQYIEILLTYVGEH